MNILAHASFIGTTGYSNHSRDFLTALNKLCTVKVRNYTTDTHWKWPSKTPHDGNEYLTGEHRKMLHQQILHDNNGFRSDYPIYSYDENFIANKHIVLNETNHHIFYDDYAMYKIAYNVWEATLYPKQYFDKLLEFDELWVPSKWQKECAIAQGYPENKISVVPEGIDTKTFCPTHRRKVNKKFQFIIVGRWEYRKSTKEIIEAWLNIFKNSSNVELLLLVDNLYAKDGMKSTEERLEKYGLENDNIKIVHFLSRNEYVKTLKNTDVFISCARSEGWNLPLIEAMACGIPSIYSNWGGQLEFASGNGIPVAISDVKPANIGMPGMLGNYCEPNFKNLETKLSSVFANHGFFKEIALNESVEIRKNFSWENAAMIAFNILNDSTKISTDVFDWGNSNEWFRKTISEEIFISKIYERFFTVEENDVVVDFGASIGPFAYSIMNKKPKRVICVEPSTDFFNTLTKNVPDNDVVSNCCTAIGEDGVVITDVYGKENVLKSVPSISFMQFIKQYDLKQIDFLKTDCEGGEYEIFSDNNIGWILNNVKKIAGEWHLNSNETKIKFRKFRDTYLKIFTDFEVYSVDGVDIKQKLFDDSFIDYYTEIIIHIDNRKIKSSKPIQTQSNTEHNFINYFVDGPFIEISGGQDAKYEISFTKLL